MAIVWRETSLEVVMLQPIRTLCEECGEAYVRLARDRFKSTARGIPYVSLVAGEDGRRDRVAEMVEQELLRRAPLRDDHKRCPECDVNPPSEPPTRRQAVLGLSLYLAAAGLVVSWVASWWIGNPLVIPTFVPGAAAGAALGVAIGLFSPLVLTPKWKAERDPRSRTEAEWNELSADCDTAGLDPAKVWLYRDLMPDSAAEGVFVASTPPFDWTRGADATEAGRA